MIPYLGKQFSVLLIGRLKTLAWLWKNIRGFRRFRVLCFCNFDGKYNFEKLFSRKVSIVPLSRERENSSLTHHFWSCKPLDKVIQGPSTLQEVFWTSLCCSHLHRFVSSTQSLTLWSGCHDQQEHYGQQGLCEQDCFRRDDSNNK